MTKQSNNIIVSETNVSCEGDLESKHPKIYLRLHNDRAICPYCARVFIFQAENILLKKKHIK